MDIETLNGILRKFVTNTRGIEDAVLVSDEAELISDPVQGWDEESIVGMVVAMFGLTDKTYEHLGWLVLDQMWLQTADHFLIGIRCSTDVYLLVKAIHAGRLGELRMAIDRAVEQLRAALDNTFIESPLTEPTTDTTAPPTTTPPPASTDNRVKYRNRKLLY